MGQTCAVRTSFPRTSLLPRVPPSTSTSTVDGHAYSTPTPATASCSQLHLKEIYGRGGRSAGHLRAVPSSASASASPSPSYTHTTSSRPYRGPLLLPSSRPLPPLSLPLPASHPRSSSWRAALGDCSLDLAWAVTQAPPSPPFVGGVEKSPRAGRPAGVVVGKGREGRGRRA